MLAICWLCRICADKTKSPAPIGAGEHDELNFNVPVAEVDRVREIVVSEMQNVVHLTVPLIADCGVGTNWLQAHYSCLLPFYRFYIRLSLPSIRTTQALAMLASACVCNYSTTIPSTL